MHLYRSIALLGFLVTNCHSFSARLPLTFYSSQCSPFSKSNLYAKKQRKTADAFGDWYEDVNQDATPDDVFWEEMERQRALAGVPVSSAQTDDPFAAVGAVGTIPASNAKSITDRRKGDDTFSSMGPNIQNVGANVVDEQQSKAALATYTKFMVDDNWINEEYALLYGSQDMDDIDLQEQDAELDRQLDAWSKEEENDDISSTGINPWDTWNPEGIVKEDEEDSPSRGLKIDSAKAKSDIALEFLLDPDVSNYDDEKRMAEEEEGRVLQKMGEIQLKSEMLENARNNPKAKEFFAREPNVIDGCDRMWASAIDNACTRNLFGNFQNYGVEFACNFGDWVDGCPEDSMQSIEDIASYKARKVFEVTGLPTIASRTSFEVEPAKVPDRKTPMNRGFENTRVSSGYRFNNIDDHVDYVVEALKPYSEPTRKTRFRSCFCYYDGEIEIYDYGQLDCDIYFSNSMRTYIPMSAGINEIGKTLQLTFGLEFQGYLRKRVREALQKSDNKVSIKLRDRVLKDAKVLPNNIVDVSSFIDSMVDVNLMDDCAKELATRFEKYKPNKILTIATTGLVLAIPMAKYLQVPVVYARKERNVVMSDTYIAGYSSNTIGKNRELLVSKNHLTEGERVLVIDDFLSSGSSQEALLRIISDAGAHAVGVGVLIEKSYEAGRKSLSGFDIPVESLVRIASVADGILTLVEEEGFVDM